MIRSISAITLFVADMARSVAFYQTMGFRLKYGGPNAAFTSFFVGDAFLNLTTGGPPSPETGWGRAIFHVDDVDGQYATAIAAGYKPSFEPRDASWGERFFHIRDPDGHELSFARPL